MKLAVNGISTEIGSRLHQLFDFLNLEERLDEARGPFRVRITFCVSYNGRNSLSAMHTSRQQWWTMAKGWRFGDER